MHNIDNTEVEMNSIQGIEDTLKGESMENAKIEEQNIEEMYDNEQHVVVSNADWMAMQETLMNIENEADDV